jgi:flagellar M-ring protein FliF
MSTEIQTGSNPLKVLNALTFNQKISLAVLAVTVIAGITAMVYFVNQDEYQTLYSELGPEEAAVVVEKLQAMNVPYRLGNSGRSVEAPSDRLNELRLQLASEGLPQAGKIGFEIFDQNNMGMTEFVERVSYKRALEGELVRTMLSLKEIGQARVHLVLPKESMFEEKAEPTKASVIVKLRSGKALSEPAVSGIVHLVSSAVEGLTPDNVTVVDSNGRLLSGTKGRGEEALTGNQAELKIRTERELTAKVVNILEPVVGQGKVRADTSVMMDFSRAEQTEEKYDPQGVIRSQQKNEERSEPSAPAAGTAAGVPGTKSNDANPPPVFIPTGRNGSTGSRQSETTNYELSKVVRRTLQPAGQITRVSVAVIVDDAVRTETGTDGVPVRRSAPRGPEDLKKLNDLVGAAIGIDPKRGDTLTVENIAFEAPAELQEVPPTFLDNLRPLARPALRYGVLLVTFLLVYMLLVRPLSHRIFVALDEVGRASRAERALTAGSAPPSLAAAPRTVQEMEAALEQEPAGAFSPAADVQKADILKKRIAEFVQREPEKGAQVLRAWLTDEGK